jgi:hypothetical protein
MAAPAIIALIVIILFGAYLGWLYLVPVFEIAVNGLLIYVIFLRSYAEIMKEQKHYFYLAGAAAAIIVYVLTGNFLKNMRVWGFTTWLVLAMMFSQIGIAGHLFYKKHGK